MQIRYAILAGEMITARFGKLSLIGSPLRLRQDLWFDFGLLPENWTMQNERILLRCKIWQGGNSS
jgi:hypothetical protein